MKTGKRSLSFFLALLMLLSCVNVGSITAYAAEALGVVVKLDKTRITAGEETTITATVSLSEATVANSFGFDVSASGLTLTGISTGDSNVAQKDIDDSSNVSIGRVGWVNTQIEDGADVSIQTLAVLTFTAPASLTAEASPISLSFNSFALTADGGFDEIFSVDVQPAVSGDLAIIVEEAAAPENSHTVTFVNHDGTVLQSGKVVEGETPAYTAAPPEKTVEGYVYTFSGWSDGTTTYGADETLPAVTGEVTYTAQFSQSKQKYTVTYTGDNINMAPTQHEWGTQVTPAIPTLDGYYFVEWTTTNTNVTIIDGKFTMPVGNVTLVGRFAEAADVEIPEGYERVKYYENPEYITASTDTTTVDYYGNNYPWFYKDGILHSGNAGVNAESQIAFTAERAGILTMLYRVSTQQAHGNELLYMYDTPITSANAELAVNYNDYKNFSGPQVEFTELSIPLKAGQTVFFAKQNIFANGGGHEDTAYLKELTFEVLPIYTATFNNYDGTELQTGPVTQGDSPVYTGATPAKPGEDGVSYIFNGWTDGENTYAPGAALPAATGDVTYTAVFIEAASSYTVTFVNHDGTVLQTGEWAAGETPAYTGATPVKAKTDTVTYDFTGWSPEIVPAAGNATYTAQYVERERTPVFKFVWDAAAYNGNVKLYTSHLVYQGMQTFQGWRTEKLVNGAWVDTWDFEPLIPGGSNAWGINGSTTVQINVMHSDIAEGYVFDGVYVDGVKMEMDDYGFAVDCPGVTVSAVQTNSTDFMVKFTTTTSKSRLEHEIEVRFKKLDSYPVTVDLADGIESANYTVKSYYDTACEALREERSGVLSNGAVLALTENCQLTVDTVTEVGVPAKVAVNGQDLAAVTSNYDGATGKTTGVYALGSSSGFNTTGNTLAITPDNGPSFVFTSNIEGAGFIAQTTSVLNSLYYYVDKWPDPAEYWTQDTKYPPVNYVTGTAGQTVRFCVVPWVQNGYRFVGLYDSNGNRVASRGEDNVYTGYKRSFDLTYGDGPQKYEMRFEKVEMVDFTVHFDESEFATVTYRPYYYLYKDATSQMQHSGEWTAIHDGDTISVPKNTVVQFKSTNKLDANWVKEYLFKGFYVNDELITAKDPSQNAVDIMFGDGDSGSYLKLPNHTVIDLLTVKNTYADVEGYSAEGLATFQTRQDYPWYGTQLNGETVLTPGGVDIAGTFSYFRLIPEEDGMLVFQYKGDTSSSGSNSFFYGKQASDPTSGTTITVGKQTEWKTFTLQVTAGTEYRFCFKQYAVSATAPSSLYIKDMAVVPVSTYTINYSSANETAGLVSATGLTGDTGATGTAETGKDVTVTASAKDGYRFVKWAEVDANGNMTTVCTTTAYTFAVMGDRKLVATFAPAFEGDALAKINDVEFGSLDDALTYATGGDTIILLKDFTLTESLTIPKGITVQIPYSDEVGTTANHLIQPDFYANDYVAPSVFRTFTINAGVTLTVQGGLVVDGRLAAKGQNDGTNATPAGPGARLIVNRGGSVVVSSGGQMSVWGYVTAPDDATLAGWNESGETAVTIRNGATLREAFQLRDWRGGTNTSNMTANEQKVFPFSQYYVQNVELPLVIETGARNLVCTGVFAGGTLAVMPDMPFVCSDGMFVLNRGSLKRTYDAATDRTYYDVNGNLRINNITLEVLGLVTVTSVAYTLPINSNLTIRVKGGSAVDFDLKQDVCFLPGSELIVEEGATLNVSGKLYFYDSNEWTGKGAVFSGRNLTQVKYVAALNGAPVTRNTNTDAKLLVGGTVNVLKNGALYTTQSGANICGSGESGKIILNAAAPKDGNTYQSKSNADEANIITIPITAAQLMNADSSYTATANAEAGAAFYYRNGAWTGSEHIHDYTYRMGSDETGHWGICECGVEDTTVESHKDEGEKDHKCDVCEFTMSECADGDDADHECDYCGKDGITDHTYSEPAWVWTGNDAEGYTTAATTFACACGDKQTVTDSDIAVETTPATATEDGKTVYTASVEFGGKTYTDTKEVAILATGPEVPEEPEVPVFGCGSEAAEVTTTVDQVTGIVTSEFKAGTGNSAPTVTVKSAENGWKIGEENTFTVSCEKACVVLVKNAEGVYTRLTTTGETGGAYGFSATIKTDDEIVVAVKGDADGNGVVGTSDYIAIARSLLPSDGSNSKYQALDTLEAIRADADSKNGVGTADYIAIARSLLPSDGSNNKYQAIEW